MTWNDLKKDKERLNSILEQAMKKGEDLGIPLTQEEWYHIIMRRMQNGMKVKQAKSGSDNGSANQSGSL